MSDYQVIQAIYPDYLSFADPLLVLTVPVELDCTLDGVSLSSLPPVVISLALPTTIVSIHSTHNWLDPHLIPALKAFLLSLEPALDTWIEAVRTGSFLSHLGLLHSSALALPPSLLPLLTAHASLQIHSSFQAASHRCDICLSHYKGAKCIQLDACTHVFCKQCLADFWGICIREGDVDRVLCPTLHCHHPNLSTHDLSSILSNDQIDRLAWLKEKKAYDSDPSIIPCPIKSCQSPVHKPPQSSNSWDNLRQCPKCFFSFCALCRRTWHGPVEPCSTTSTDLSSLISIYVALCSLPSPEALAKKTKLEKQYGFNTLKRLTKKHKEDQASQKYLNENTTKCPGKGCNAFVEKNRGCNHITCTQCKSHFCYLCGSTLDPSQPYTHFSRPGMSPNSSCLNKLFDNINPDPDDWEIFN